MTKDITVYKELYQELKQFAENVLHITSLRAIKLGRGCTSISSSPGYHFGYLMCWQNQSEDITHSEYSSDASSSSFGLKNVSLRQLLPDDWMTTRFIMFLSSESPDMDDNNPNSGEEHEHSRLNPALHDLSRPMTPVNTGSTLETIPEGDERDEDEEPVGPVNQLTDDEIYLQVQHQNPGESGL